MKGVINVAQNVHWCLDGSNVCAVFSRVSFCWRVVCFKFRCLKWVASCLVSAICHHGISQTVSVSAGKIISSYSSSYNSMFVFTYGRTCCCCVQGIRSRYLQNFDAHIPTYSVWHPRHVKWLSCYSDIATSMDKMDNGFNVHWIAFVTYYVLRLLKFWFTLRRVFVYVLTLVCLPTVHTCYNISAVLDHCIVLYACGKVSGIVRIFS
jgi:hypothetical protein